MTVTLGQLASRMTAAPVKLRAEMTVAVRQAGVLLAGSARSSMPNHLRGVGASGAAIGATVLPVVGARRVTTIVKATGPAHLVDNPTKAHTIKAKGTPLRTPYGPRMSVRVGGTGGKHTFRRGVKAGEPAARALVEAAFARASVSVFGH